MMTDPIADMLTQVRNANTALRPKVAMPASKAKEEIAKILVSEGFVDGYEVEGEVPRRDLVIKLRYDSDRKRALRGLRRISSPGRRIYKGATELPRSRGGLGVVIVSTSQGLLPDREARRRKLGGEVMCEVW